jgi:beta-carotene/zeaxanthin 4-ketolase
MKAKLEEQYGISIASCIITLWAISTTLLLSLNGLEVSLWWLPFAVGLQTFLYTGLFITAHDAMHGLVYRHNLKLNHLIGQLCLLLYGLLSYEDLLNKHQLHHRYPATEKDPDFHNHQHKNFFCWYLYFMKNYWNWFQILGLATIFHISNYCLHISQVNLIVFWILPSLLSSIQLFYFGTFLTHREPTEGYNSPHRAQSNPLPILLSFITCYHFGYHQEHHQYPNVPWWQLPKVYKDCLAGLLVE